MFAEEEWTDAVSEETCPVITEAHPGKCKPVSKLCLKRTLQTLGSVPDWETSRLPEGSDGEHENSQHSPKKRRKKKTKKQRKSSGTGAEDQPNLVERDAEVIKTTVKKRQVKPRQKPQDGETNTVAKELEEGGGVKKLTRQQWKNKIKNKRRCKNKFLNKTDKVIKDGVKKPEKTEPIKRCFSEETPDPVKLSHPESKKFHAVSEKQINGRKQTNKQTEPRRDAQDAGEKQKPLTKDLQLKARKLRCILNAQVTSGEKNPTQNDEEHDLKKPSTEEETGKVPDRSSALRSRMEKRLESARFRYINELLYTSTSGEAKRMFKQDPDAIEIYHKGYTAQVSHWPANPVDSIISFIQKKPASLVIADFGCGDCKIARSVRNKVHCFDLAPVCDLVTVCDMAHVPLPDSSVDIAVFCLSLMGTNLTDFLAEANRVLVPGGVLKIAEVASRFEDIRQFTGVLSRLGYKLVSKDTENSHFYSFEFSKTQEVPEKIKKIRLELKPCLYKKR